MSRTAVRTISDIAPLTGEETKQRIRSVAREHRFQINVPAQRLSTKQSNTVAFVTHAYHKEFSVADLFGLEIMGGISSGLYADGYDLLVVHVDPRDTNWA